MKYTFKVEIMKMVMSIPIHKLMIIKVIVNHFLSNFIEDLKNLSNSIIKTGGCDDEQVKFIL